MALKAIVAAVLAAQCMVWAILTIFLSRRNSLFRQLHIPIFIVFVVVCVPFLTRMD